MKWGLLASHVSASRGSQRVALIKLFVVQAVALIAFAWFKWSAPVPGGTLAVLKRGLSGIQALQRAPVPQGIESGLRESALGLPPNHPLNPSV